MPIHIYIEPNSDVALEVLKIIQQHPNITYQIIWQKIQENQIKINKPQLNVLLNNFILMNRISKNQNKEYWRA